ncbi:hypothetical protein C8R46DRAFT_1072403 [Mycena filopes]|nr:hypothetical protein C8R46DRAFT_1072403 [Mycena filopes]
MDSATAKFQAALPYALLPVSPSLSALHSVRVRSSAACQQCGCALHRGESSVRTVRTVSKTRAIQTTCLICGWVQQQVPLARGNASLFPRTRKARTNVAVAAPLEKRDAMHEVQPSRQSIAPKDMPRTQQEGTPDPGAAASKSVSAKSRSKKKGGLLQSMLARNKEKESKEKQNGNSGALAAFLDNL